MISFAPGNYHARMSWLYVQTRVSGRKIWLHPRITSLTEGGFQVIFVYCIHRQCFYNTSTLIFIHLTSLFRASWQLISSNRPIRTINSKLWMPAHVFTCQTIPTRSKLRKECNNFEVRLLKIRQWVKMYIITKHNILIIKVFYLSKSTGNDVIG